jgi:hypothetical protein
MACEDSGLTVGLKPEEKNSGQGKMGSEEKK